MYACLRWPPDFLLKAHTSLEEFVVQVSMCAFRGMPVCSLCVKEPRLTQAPLACTYDMQVGDGSVEHSYWGRPELETLPRPAFKVDVKHAGSEPPAEAAAAMAAGYLVFKDHGAWV